MKVDGRHLRGERTLQKLVQATRFVLMEHLMKGAPRPRVCDITRYANCSTRTFFMHFANTDDAIRKSLAEHEIINIARTLRDKNDIDLVVMCCNWSRDDKSAVVGRE